MFDPGTLQKASRAFWGVVVLLCMCGLVASTASMFVTMSEPGAMPGPAHVPEPLPQAGPVLTDPDPWHGLKNISKDEWLKRVRKNVGKVSLDEYDIVRAFPPEDFTPPGLLNFMDEDYFKEALEDETGQGLCIITVVDAFYVDFIPPLIKSIAESHPQAKTIVYTSQTNTTRWIEAMYTLQTAYNIVTEKYSIEEIPEFQDLPRKVAGSSLFAMLRFVNYGNKLKRHGCKFSYIIDSDSFVFKSSNVRYETILKWHTKRILENRLPFDNVVRPQKDDFGCNQTVARRLSGLHFVVNDPWYEYVGPCLEIIKRLAFNTKAAGKWCSAKSHGHFLDEHALWVAARLCAVGPGERVPVHQVLVHRPVHGIHVHNRDFAGKDDQRYWCERVPQMIPTLSRFARNRYAQLNKKAHCEQFLNI